MIREIIYKFSSGIKIRMNTVVWISQKYQCKLMLIFVSITITYLNVSVFYCIQ